MLPLIIGIGISAVGYVLYKAFWDGKKIAVLGSRGVGKTTFWEFLKTKQISNEQFEATTTRRKIKRITIEEDGLKLKFSHNHDVGGGKTKYADWDFVVNDADYIFYILNIHEVLQRNSKYITSVKDDINYIGEKIRAKQPSAKVFLLATHADLQSRYKTNLNELEQVVAQNTVVNECQAKLGGSKNCKLILGSLATTKEAQNLLSNILQSAKEK